MRHGKAIDNYIDACLRTARTMGYRQTELDKLLKVLVVTRCDLSADEQRRAAWAKLEKEIMNFELQ
ncbi:MAG TPA: hypothetical protein VN648_14995 [Candidatus Methylomirabilis sp.]|nr:hypothetical protein [Candidatus Methylomirabilis sp.]